MAPKWEQDLCCVYFFLMQYIQELGEEKEKQMTFIVLRV